MHATTMQQARATAFDFFYQNAGTSRKPNESIERGKARVARQLTQAEAKAKMLGYRFEWTNDFEVNHRKEYGYEREPETCETCLMWSPDLKDIVASLSCIDDATADYRRVVEAELALEALPR